MLNPPPNQDTAARRCAGSERQSRRRRRRRLGLVVLPIEAELFALADYLISIKFLQAWDADDPEAVRRACQEWITATLRYRHA